MALAARDGLLKAPLAGNASMTVASSPSLWAKLSSRLRTDGLAATASHYWTVALHKAHVTADGLLYPCARRDPTGGKVELADVTIASPSAAAGVHYLPTPWRILDWVHDSLPTPGPAWTFVDLGCGKGRALLSAARRPYGRIVGVEFAAELAAEARAQLAAFAGADAARIEVREGDAVDVAWPGGPVVVFLFNPFGPPVIDRVAASLALSYRSAPRALIVAYLNPRHGEAFSRLPGLAEIPLPPALDWRFRWLSPYQLRLFATPDAIAHFVAPGP